MATAIPSQDSEEPVLSLIQKIKDKIIDPKILSKEERLLCVEALLFEGYTEAQIAQVLSRSQKTIKRDLQDIRDQNAITPNVELAKKLVGELLRRTEVHRSYLMRLARKSEGSVGEKSQAEFMAWRVVKESCELLQGLGYMPQQAKEITGDIYHHGANELMDVEDLKKQVEHIESLALECGELPPEAKMKIDGLKDELKKIQIADELKKIRESSTPKEKNND